MVIELILLESSSPYPSVESKVSRTFLVFEEGFRRVDHKEAYFIVELKTYFQLKTERVFYEHWNGCLPSRNNMYWKIWMGLEVSKNLRRGFAWAGSSEGDAGF